MPNRVGFSGTSGVRGRHGCCSMHTCRLCLEGAKWLPVVLIVAIVSWSYYAYIVHLCIFTVITESGAVPGVILAAVYHVFLVPFLMSYWQTVWARPGNVPPNFGLTVSEVDIIETASEPLPALENLVANKDLAVVTRSMQGEVRYCSECSHIKPDRAHHCSVCNDCVLKMDHHCPWVNNCVGYYNQKFFFLFLGYAFLYCMYVMLSTLKYFIAYWSHENAINISNGKFHVIFLFFVSGMFAISLCSLFGYHIYLISQNRTTLEAFRPPLFRHGGSDRRGFHLGKCNNFREVLGDQPLLWFVPVFSSLGDGLTFPRQCQYDEDPELGSSGLAESRDYINNRLHQSQNRRFQTSSMIESEDFSDDDDDNEGGLLLPPKTRETTANGNNSRKTWQDQDDSLQAETSPDSLASAASTSGAGPEVKYEGFSEFNYNNKPNVNLS